MKSLIPSQRENKRYLLLKGKNLKRNVYNSVFQYIGTLGMSEASLQWIFLEGESGVISINRESLDKVRASFCLYKDRIEVIRVSGTLKGLKNEKFKLKI